MKFDFPADPPGRSRRLRGQFTGPPDDVLRAVSPAEVPAVVAAAEHAARSGCWVLGGLSYGASGAWDPAQVALRDDTAAAHFEVYAGDPEPWPTQAGRPPELDWVPETGMGGGRTGREAIEQVLRRIAAGDCYQVNLTTRHRAAGDLDRLFEALAATQPGGYLLGSTLAGIGCVSPELFFHLEDGHLVTQPMKGTAWADPRALETAKERAENLMIVDLLRNDLSRVCRLGTVRVDRLFEVHRLPTLWQLTSTVSGTVRAGTGLADVFAALFPCGSVTGAPKLAAMEVIAELEPGPRGWYCGAVGVLRPGGTATFAVPIRTVAAGADGLVCGVGSGIVIESDPDTELAEWRAKTAFLGGTRLRALETMLAEDGAVVRRAA
ncbi:MAG: anthranilate synthase component I family protein, partial [Propionicimonas sp.]